MPAGQGPGNADGALQGVNSDAPFAAEIQSFLQEKYRFGGCFSRRLHPMVAGGHQTTNLGVRSSKSLRTRHFFHFPCDSGDTLHKGSVQRLIFPNETDPADFSDVSSWGQKMLNLLNVHRNQSGHQSFSFYRCSFCPAGRGTSTCVYRREPTTTDTILSRLTGHVTMSPTLKPQLGMPLIGFFLFASARRPLTILWRVIVPFSMPLGGANAR